MQGDRFVRRASVAETACQRSPIGHLTEHWFDVHDEHILFNASKLRTRTLAPSIDAISTRCSPTGFGRSDDRVLNTPVAGLAGSQRG